MTLTDTEGAAPPLTRRHPRIIGLDPSLTSFGFALVNPAPGIAPTLTRLRPKTRGHERLALILQTVTAMAAECDLAVMEGAVLVAKGGGENRLALAGLHWQVRHRLWEIGVPYAVVAPTTRAKYITGNGAAGKEDCLIAVLKRFPGAVVSGNDEADALTLAAMGAEYLGFPLAPMPAAATALLRAARADKNHRGEPVIAWPEMRGGGDG